MGISDIKIGEELLHRVESNAKNGTGALFVQMYLYNEKEGRFEGHVFAPLDLAPLKTVIGILDIDIKGVKVPIRPNTFTEQIIKERKLIITNDLYEAVSHSLNEKICKLVQSLLGIRRIVIAPIILEDEVFGVVNFVFRKDEIGKEVIEAFVDQIRLIFEKSILEQDLRRSEEKYRTIFEKAPIGIFTLNKEGVVTAINPYQMERVEGIEKPETYIGNFDSLVQAKGTSYYDLLKGVLSGTPFFQEKAREFF